MLLFWNLLVLHLGSLTRLAFLVDTEASFLINKEFSFLKSLLANLKQICSRLLLVVHINVPKDDVQCSFLDLLNVLALFHGVPDWDCKLK